MEAPASGHQIREMSVRWKINAIPVIQSAVFQLDPISGLADAWGFTAQMDDFFTEGNGKAMFGESQHVAVEACRELRTEIRALALSVAGEERYQNVLPRLQAWLADNPVTDITFSRHATQADAAGITAAEWGSGGLESVGRIEDLVRDLSDRLAIYAAQQPEIARSHAELLVMETYRYMLDPVWKDIESLTRAAVSVDERIQSIDAFATSTPELIATERDLILAAVRSELDTALDDVDRQRVDTIAALSDERAAVFVGIDSLRSVLLGDVDRARVAATTDLEAIVERQAQAMVSETAGLIDMVFWRALTLLAVGLVGLAIVLRVTRSPSAA